MKSMKIMPLPSNIDMILGMDWLVKYNPEINWKESTITCKHEPQKETSYERIYCQSTESSEEEFISRKINKARYTPRIWLPIRRLPF